MKKKKRFKQPPVVPASLRGKQFTFHAAWGLFSPKKVDPGTAVLANAIPVEEGSQILDIGCGYGVLGLALASDAPQGAVHLVDKDFVAVEYAKKNAEQLGLTNVEVYLSDGLRHVPKETHFDIIASNIPAKIGNELLHIIFSDSLARLKKGGWVYVVTISGLKSFIKREFLEVFGNYKKIKQSGTYVVSAAQKR